MAKKIKENRYIHNGLAILRKNKYTVLTVILFITLGDIIFIPDNSDVRTFAILGLCILSMKLYVLKSKVIFVYCLLLLLVMFVSFVASGTSVHTEKAAVWFVLFFAVGIIRQWKE
jgi:hypothetical protein